MEFNITFSHAYTWQVVSCYFESGYLDTRVFLLDNLKADHTIVGPAIIIDKNR